MQDVKNTKGGAEEIVTRVKDTTVLALEGARDIGSAALGGVMHVVAGSTSQALKATEEVSGDLAEVSKKVVVNWIRGFQGIAAAVGGAMLENARGSVKGAGVLGADAGAVARGAAKGVVAGAGEVGMELGAVTKTMALGLIQGGSEISAELGKACKDQARGAIQGLGEIGSDLVAVTRSTAIEAIKAGTEVALLAEDGIMKTAKAAAKDVEEIRATPPEPKVTAEVPVPVAANGRNGKHN